MRKHPAARSRRVLFYAPALRAGESVDNQREENQDDRSYRRDNEGGNRPCLQAGLDVHAGEVGHHMEVGVVEVAGAHRGKAQCQRREVGVDAQGGNHGSNDRGTGDHGRGAGALREPHDHTDQDRDQDAGDTGGNQPVRHDLGSADIVDDSAQRAAGGGDEHDGAGVLAGIAHQLHAGLAVKFPAEEERADAQGDEQRHHGVTDQLHDSLEGGSVQRGDLADDGVGEDQHDGAQQGEEGHERARQLLGGQQVFKVLVLQFLALAGLLGDAVEDGQLRRGVLGAVDFLIADDQVRILLAVVPEEEHGGDEQRDGDQQAVDDVQAEVQAVAVLIERRDNRQRAGGRRHHEVRDIQAHAEDAAQPDHALLGQAGEFLRQRGQDDETGIAEHRDGYHKTGQAEHDVAVLDADQLQDGQGHPLGSSGFLQENTHDTSEADDDTDALHRVAETGGHRVDDVTDRHRQDGDQDRGDNQGWECVHPGKDDQQQHDHNTDCHGKYRAHHDWFPPSILLYFVTHPGEKAVWSDHRAEAEDIHAAVIAQRLIPGHLSVQDLQQQREGFLADLLDRLLAGDDPPGVQVHIMLHPLIGVRVAADLDHGHGGESLRGAAPGGEHHHLRAGGRHAGEDLRLASGGILDPQALLPVRAVAVFQHALDRPVAGFHDGAEALFLDAAQSAGDVAGRRLAAAHILADGHRALFHFIHDSVNLLSDRAVLAAHGAPGQDMLPAQELRRLAKDHRCAQVHQLIRHIADHAVAGHAAGGIAGAALDRHGQFGDVRGFPLHA